MIQLLKKICLLLLLHRSFGAEILAIFPISGSSHIIAPQAIIKALARRGHNLTVISSYPQKIPNPNIQDIDVSFTMKNKEKSPLTIEIVKTVLQNSEANLRFITSLSHSYCDIIFSLPEVQKLKEKKFDLVMTEIFGADCTAGFAWKFDAPLISILISRRTPWALSRVGNPDNPSHMPMIDTSFKPEMNFFERLLNTFRYLHFSLVYEFRSNVGKTDEISRNFFGKNVPPVKEIVLNYTSMVFVNSHFTIDQSYARVPNLIEIAGAHINPPKELPKDIKQFLDDAKHGVIYFTLGSLVRVSSLPKEVIKAFRDAFAELPQRVIWKFELELENKPDNVLTGKWFPQSDIFTHENIILYLTHGGNSGCIEAAHYGIPMVGIPLFFDQHRNIQSFVDKRVAVKLDVNNLTKENILDAIKTVVNDEGYYRRMKELSQRFNDREMSPVDSAVYWTEYVIRHKGAPHLKISSIELPFYQYFLLDIITFCIAATLIIIYVIKTTFVWFIYKLKYIIFVRSTNVDCKISKKYN